MLNRYKPSETRTSEIALLLELCVTITRSVRPSVALEGNVVEDMAPPTAHSVGSSRSFGRMVHLAAPLSACTVEEDSPSCPKQTRFVCT